MKWAACVTGSKTITNSAGSCSDMSAFSPAGSSMASMLILSSTCSKSCFGQIDARAPENLPEILEYRQRVGVVRRDPAQAGTDGEGDFDHLVQRRLIATSAQRAVIVLLVHGPQRLRGLEHATATRAEDVPAQLEQPEPGRMKERADCFFLVQPVPGGKAQGVDTAQAAGRCRRGSPIQWRQRRFDRPNCGESREVPGLRS